MVADTSKMLAPAGGQQHFYDLNGIKYATKYSYNAGFNISTPNTPTSQVKVFINHIDNSKSSIFPFYQK